MRKLIKADIGRILGKKAIWILMALAIILVSVETLADLDMVNDRGFSFLVGAVDITSYMGFILGFILILGVYADDFKSTAYINTIGRGFSRIKFITAKFLDVIFIVLGCYAVIIVLVFILKAIAGVSFLPVEYEFYFFRMLTDILCTIACVVISSVFFYLTENATIGVLVYLSVELLIPLVLELTKIVPAVKALNLDKIYITGASSIVTSYFLMGSPGIGTLLLLLIIVGYIGGSIAASVLIFKKKELDF